MDFIQDLLAALGSMLNGLPQAIVAMGLGFSAFTTSFALIIGAGLTLTFQSVAPLSFQAEAIMLVGQQGKDAKERYSIVFWSSVLLLAIGATGTVTHLISFVGQDIIDAMMAGVGIMLAKIGIDNIKAQPKTGAVSLVVALVTFMATKDLLWTIIASVVLSSLYHTIVHKDQLAEDSVVEKESVQFHKPLLSWPVMRGALSLTCLSVATIISYGLLTGQMTGIDPNPLNVNHYTLTQAVANGVASLFGGAPIAAVISTTGAALNPVRSGVIMMLVLALILLARLLPKIAKYIPSSAIAGFLFVLGVFVTFPDNAANALTVANNWPAALTLIITAVSDPFTGLVCGGVMKYVLLFLA